MTTPGPKNVIKMFSLLNVSNGSNKSGKFNVEVIEVLVDSKEENWFKRAHIGRYLGIAHIIKSTAKLSEEDIRSRAFLQAEGGSIVWTSSMVKWDGQLSTTKRKI